MLTLDQVKNKSSARLIGLHPVVQQATVRLIELAYQAGVPIVITQGLRTVVEQDALYAQGRTKSGQIVTNARGGYSNHNFGVAIDFALLMPDGRSVSWDMTRDGDGDRRADWMEVTDIAKRLGFSWGGDWTSFKDYPHFEMTFGLSTAEYRGGKKPSQAAQAVALAIINKEDLYIMRKVDADKYIELEQAAYAAAKKRGDKQGADEAHRLANELRKASGQPVQK
ncbi:M15 family metallopeptidase [Paenibacillus sp. MMS18-CY102]|uniref:M15 family metallopeptidase n=1 Tax=Paenibacillus sp. MMS18-CY102 TaxID=2682849 RepID=UPI001F31BAC6|nr:M15 family metallopeptidase [Paenibacillus sp. MMS18-CY102]